jgi:hypothetical protein
MAMAFTRTGFTPLAIPRLLKLQVLPPSVVK